MWNREPMSLLPTAVPTHDDVLFFAGFYEGEGNASGECHSTTVRIPQKDAEMLHRGRSLWGGSVRPKTGADMSVWLMSGDRARRFLIAIYPYLSARRKQQIEKAGGLRLTGRRLLGVAGMEPERVRGRASMSAGERHRETYGRWRTRNRDYQREWRKDNREKVNGRRRELRALAKLPQEISERTPLIQ